MELLAATSFVDSTAVHAPTTSASALFRILDMLGKHDFALSPLVVNLDVDGGKEQGSKLAAQALNVIHSSKVKSGSSLFILSSNDILGYDEADALPADSAIEKVSLSLIQRCASESALHLMSRALDNGTSSESANTLLFEDGTLMDEQCNLVLHFSSSLHSKGSRGHLTGPKFASLKVYANTVHTSCNPSRLVIADPSSSSENVVQEEIVAKLRSRFQDIAIFFWDETVGDRLGVIFKPSAFLSTAFSSTNSSRKMPTNDGPKSKAPMISDISQIAASIYACGNGSFCDISFR